MREIILDTETTGLDFRKGDRLIEIGCIELINRIPTGREYHCFINPEHDVPAEAEAVHGITTAFLVDKPVFAKVYKDFLAFIGSDTLVIHNASFDVGFLNFELERMKAGRIENDRVVDTLALARRKHPAGPNTLDALCKRYGIDISKRTRHGALIDCLLLAEVYIELLGVRQAALGLGRSDETGEKREFTSAKKGAKQRPHPLPSRIGPAETAAHKTFIGGLAAKAVWLKYWPSPGTGKDS